MTTNKLILLLIVIMAFTNCSDGVPEEKSIEVYIQYESGNIPIIIIAGHGGNERPEWIKDRNCEDAVTVQDEFTLELVEEIRAAFLIEGNLKPYIITNELHRAKLDPNRNKNEGSCLDPYSEKAWALYHSKIEEAKNGVSKEFNRGLIVDVHGHGHDLQRIELGYLLYEDELQKPAAEINSSTIINFSSIKALALNNTLGLTHAELLTGEHAFGTLLSNEGYPSVPSQSIPFPLTDEPYFSGGYTIAQHSSYTRGVIDGIQMECNRSNVRDTPENRKAFAVAFVKTCVEYLDTHY